MAIPENECPAVFIDKVLNGNDCVLLDATVGPCGIIHVDDVFTLYKNPSISACGNKRTLKLDLDIKISIKTITRPSLFEVSEAASNDVVHLLVTGRKEDLDELSAGMWLVVGPDSL